MLKAREHAHRKTGERLVGQEKSKKNKTKKQGKSLEERTLVWKH